jgi:hypothetical protein
MAKATAFQAKMRPVRTRVDNDEAAIEVAEVLEALSMYESVCFRPEVTGYEILPIVAGSMLLGRVEHLRGMFCSRKLPCLGETVWSDLVEAANSRSYQTKALIGEFRSWLVYWHGVHTFGVGIRPTEEEQTSTSLAHS